jgi:hypothetical protein
MTNMPTIERPHAPNPRFALPSVFVLYRDGLLYRTATNVATLAHVVRHNPDFASGERATIATYNLSSAIDVRAEKS